jgi:apolipoprotein N-acyltransferase
MWSIGHWGFGMSWLIVSVYYYGETSIAVSLIIFVLLILILTLFFSLPLLVIRTNFFQDLRYSSLKYILLVISIFVLNEWSMYYLLNGVPWLIPGVVFLDTFTQNIYPLLGVAGAPPPLHRARPPQQRLLEQTQPPTHTTPRPPTPPPPPLPQRAGRMM